MSNWFVEIDLVATGEQLRRKRREHNLSQEELSKRFDEVYDPASRIAISNWENGKKMPSWDHMVKLARLYGCLLDELVVCHEFSREADDRDQPVHYLCVLNIVVMR